MSGLYPAFSHYQHLHHLHHLQYLLHSAASHCDFLFNPFFPLSRSYLFAHIFIMRYSVIFPVAAVLAGSQLVSPCANCLTSY
jgi:hypothetical protein